MASARDVGVYRKDQASSGKILSAPEREALLRKYLPSRDDLPLSNSTPNSAQSGPRNRRKPIRTFIKTSLHLLVFTIIQVIFGIYIRGRRLYRALKSILLQILYHHHRTPELIKRDVAQLQRLPKHLSVILTLPNEHPRRRGLRRRKQLLPSAALDALLDEVAELATWSAAVGIPLLSIYEPTGVLKNCIPATHNMVRARFMSYFGGTKAPTLQIRAPHMPSYLNGDDDETMGKHYEFDSATSGDEDGQREGSGSGHLDVLILSEEDGRATMVDLTKTLAEMSQKGKILPGDVGVELIDAELSESFSAVEPDLLMLFGDKVVLQGYPPWQLRLTEIYCAGEGSGGAVDYPTWLKGLYRFAKAEMRFGR